MTKQETRWIRESDLPGPLEPGYHRDPMVHKLRLRVQDTKTKGRTKSWVLEVEINGQVTHIGLGCYPAVAQEEARRRAWAAQDEIAAGRDPRRKNAPTVRQLFIREIDERSSSKKIWRSKGTRRRWEHNFRTYIDSVIGHLKVPDVTSADVMALLRRLAVEKPETARQVFSHLRQVFARAVAENLRGDDPTEAVAAALGPIHPRRRNRPMPALHHRQMREALQRVRDSGAHWATKAVFLLMTLTGTRQGEVRGARWEEIDRDRALWKIPANRTKEGRPHNVALSGPVLAVLADAWERTGGVGLVFPSATGQPISPATLRKLLRALGVDCTPHGLRATYRTWMAEHGVPDEVAELALGHTHKKVPPGIDLLEQRRAIAEQWGNYLTGNTGPDQPSPPPSQHDDTTDDPKEKGNNNG